MKKSLFATALVVPFLALSGAALAGSFPEEGKIASMNGWSVTLENGMLFQVTDSSQLKELKPGDEVKVTYTDHPEYGFINATVQKMAPAQR